MITPEITSKGDDYKSNAEKVANILVKAVKKFQFFEWSRKSNYFKQIKGIYHSDKKTQEQFLEMRGILEAEKERIGQMKPYFAFIMAPDDNEAEMVVEQCYMEHRKRIAKAAKENHNLITDANGFSADASIAEKLRDWEMFEYTFKHICRKFEKKIM